MHVYVVLLRGENVSGHNKVKMSALREALSASGFCDVGTYIQSGNIVLTSSKTAPQISDIVARCLKMDFNVSAPVLTLSFKVLSKILNEAPFDGDPSRVMLYFRYQRLDADFDDGPFQTLKLPGDQVRVGWDVNYFHAPDGIDRSKLAERMDRLVPAQLTARNVRTSRALLGLAGRPS